MYQAFPEVPAATAWLETFKQDRIRYPILVVVGPSHSGKTEWANSLFKNALELEIGRLEHFPEKMRLVNGLGFGCIDGHTCMVVVV